MRKRSALRILAGALALSFLACLIPPAVVAAAGAQDPLIQGARAIACHTESTSLAPSKALDGNASTRFAAGGGCQHNTWLVVDLGNSYDISRVKINWEAARASKYAIEVSEDGQTFTTALTETSGAAGVKESKLNATGRFVRIREISRALSQYGFSIFEIEVYGTPAATPNDAAFAVVNAESNQYGSLSLSESGFVRIGKEITVSVESKGSLQALILNGQDVTEAVSNDRYTFTVTEDTLLQASFSAPVSSSFECESVAVYSSLSLTTPANASVQSDGAASGGKIAGSTGGKYFLFENVAEANCIKLAYASPNTNSINVWLRYPGETELHAVPAIAFSTSNSWTMDSSAAYIATSAVFYIPEGSDIVLRPNADCNLDKLWLTYENTVSSDSAPEGVLPADRVSEDTVTDLMAPYAKALVLEAGESVSFQIPKGESVYNVLSVSYAGEGATLSFALDGKTIAGMTLDATDLRSYKVSSAAAEQFEAGSTLTLTCKSGTISLGYVSYNLVPDVEEIRVPSLPAAGDRLSVDLGGVWAFDSQGFSEWAVDQTVPELDFVNAIPVPGLWSSASMEEGDNNGKKAWYKKVIHLDEEPAGNVTLYIEQAQYGRYVYVNGKLADSYEYNYSASYSDLTGLLRKGENEIVIMLGDFAQQFTDKTDAAHVLSDGESRYDLPGITGAVELIFNQNPTVSKVQTNPDIEKGTLDVQITLASNQTASITTDVTVTVYELGVLESGKPTMDEVKVAEYVKRGVSVKKGENDAFLIEDIPLSDWSKDKCWTPDSPYLYRVEVRTAGDTYETRIGMRTFGYDPTTKYYTLNGELLYLRGTNVAIERYYDDPLCGTTPWQEDWVRKLYSEYKATNWFCFRTHLGNANELWFDLADEMGFLIIDEYPQWGDQDGCTTKSIMPEIYRWIDLRANHASLFMFDAQNEATGTTFTDEICRLGRAYDLQDRTWDNGWRAPVFEDSPIECHPYFLNGKGVSGMGGSQYTKPVLTMANIGWTCETYPNQPFILNEHGEIWVSRDGIPMSGTAGNWGVHLPDATPEERLVYYADVMAAQMEAFRAHRAYSGLLFFCGLGSDFPDHVGITCDILSPDVSTAESLEIRPYLQELLKNAFADLGIITEYYEEIVRRGQEIAVPVKLVNDTGKDIADLEVVLTVCSGDTVLYADRATVSVGAFSADNDGLASHEFSLKVPAYDGYCDSGEELYLIASYTLEGETVYSRRKLMIRGGSATTNDPLPEYDWLNTDSEQTPVETDTETETEPTVTPGEETNPPEATDAPVETTPRTEDTGCASVVGVPTACLFLTAGALAGSLLLRHPRGRSKKEKATATHRMK